MKINPILKKELRVDTRSMRLSWLLMAINLLLAVIVILVMSFVEQEAVTGKYDYRGLANLFPVLAIVECIVLSLLIPVMTSGAISGERERKTLDIMLTTPMKPWSIVLGKLESVLALVMLFVISGLPILAVPFIYGGMSWKRLVQYIFLLLFLGIYIGSVGIFCSSVMKRSMLAAVLTIGIGILILVVSTVGFYICVHLDGSGFVFGGMQKAGEWDWMFLAINPYLSFIEFLMKSTTGTGLLEESFAMADVKHLKILFDHWTLFSTILNLGVAALFLKLATLKLAVKKQKK